MNEEPFAEHVRINKQARPAASKKWRLSKEQVEHFLLWPLWFFSFFVLLSRLVNGANTEGIFFFALCFGISVVGNAVHGKVHWKENRWLVSALTIAALLFVTGVWPTRYRYEHTSWGDGHQQRLVRIDRLSNSAEVLTATGWLPIF